MDQVELSVIIPAYNEEINLAETVRAVNAYLSERGMTYEIIIVDDGSNDQTLSIAQSLSQEVPEVRMESYSPNHGKGYAVRTGILAAVGEGVLFTDADHATPIQELPGFLEALEGGHDVAIASRAVPGSVRVVHQPAYREIGGKIMNLLIQLGATPGLKDTQCGFKLFTRDAAQSIFPRCTIDDFSFDVEVLFIARRLGYKIAELPVHWTHHGGSRVKPLRDGFRLVRDLIRIRLHDYRLKGPSR